MEEDQWGVSLEALEKGMRDSGILGCALVEVGCLTSCILRNRLVLHARRDFAKVFGLLLSFTAYGAY